MTTRKEVEASYFRIIPEEALQQSLHKPFSIDGRAPYLMEIAVVIGQLPPPPARVIDLGCGTGWTSAFFARCGYEVLGLDLSPEAIETAHRHFHLPGLTFAVHDFDEPFSVGRESYDAAVFFDSLHHSEDELTPIRTAYDALNGAGICVICEPGTGHAESEGSLHATNAFGVRERDMSPRQILSAAKAAGFARATVLPHPHEVYRNLYAPRPQTNVKEKLLASKLGQVIRIVRAVTIQRRSWGLVRLHKS